MGKIFYIMGKSSSGKDTIYNRLRTDETLELSKLILYTTRPMREGEMQGREYHFVQEERFCRLKEDGKVIESRTYETVYGPWTYFTADDGQIADDEKKLSGNWNLRVLYTAEKLLRRRKNLPYLYRSGGWRAFKESNRQRRTAKNSQI